jgi:hypothetical protein
LGGGGGKGIGCWDAVAYDQGWLLRAILRRFELRERWVWL